MGDDRVHPDGVLVAEGLPQRVDGHEPDLGRVERVDPEVRGAARVGGAAHVTHRLHHAAVVRHGHRQLALLAPRGRVDHHAHVDVVEVAEPQHLRLAPHELEPPRVPLRHPPLHVAVLLGGHADEGHAAGQMVEGSRLEQAHRRAQHARDLRVVPARVRGPGLWIGHRMADHHEPVELAEQRERGAVAGATGHVGADAGEGQLGARGEADALEGLGDQLGGLELLEPELRLAANRLPQRDDLVAPPVDRRLDLLHQLGLGHGCAS